MKWKDIPEYEGIYQVSNTGLIKSLERYSIQGKLIKEKIINGGFDKDGYKHVLLCKDGIKKTAKVHRLVAQAFLLMNGNKPHINHKDGNRTNNNVSNLEWCNIQENNEHAFDKLNRKLSGVTSQRKPVNMLSKDGKKEKTFKTISEAVRYIQQELGILTANKTNIITVCRGRQKSAYGKRWEYA